MQISSVQKFVRSRVNVTLAVQKFVRIRRSRVNARWNRVSFCHVAKMASSTETGEENLTAADMDPLKALCFLSEGEQNKQFKRRCIACAVNVDKDNEEYLLLTSSSAIKDEDKKENLIFKRFSSKHFGRYTVKVSFHKELGEFTFLKIKDTPQANRPFQGYRRHIAGGANLLGRARGQA